MSFSKGYLLFVLGCGVTCIAMYFVCLLFSHLIAHIPGQNKFKNKISDFMERIANRPFGGWLVVGISTLIVGIGTTLVFWAINLFAGSDSPS